MWSLVQNVGQHFSLDGKFIAIESFHILWTCLVGSTEKYIPEYITFKSSSYMALIQFLEYESIWWKYHSEKVKAFIIIY